MTNREGAGRDGTSQARPETSGSTTAAAPMPKPPVRRSTPDEDDSDLPELTPEQLGELRQALEERRASLVALIDERQHAERDVSREVGDEMDEANAEGATSLTSKLLERDVRVLAEIDRALAKMKEGTYGMCEGTGEPIGYRRLRLRPWARYSVAYQEQIEREERTGGGS
ncbi:molecular chaperone DnaK [Sorangium cellulosum]|uniref:Molecular chaperone DnaK n=1 Tax=Sorangium cellulosum TaxID=56 RepID=A0A2L0FBZ7_SORCE|nr:TraR/DksA family transcriptional regulator [Sorangium cellulosum]AUX48939.1 molecular chaperone DnaK [Sorangium cellulosum]